MEQEIPRFIELRGCTNCETYKKIRKDGFSHETIIPCMILCETLHYKHSAMNPFIDPEEVVRKAKETGNQEYIKNAQKYVATVKRAYGEFYERIGVNLDNLL
jgi:hypothetical protein